MPESDESARCFESILTDELQEVRRRRAIRNQLRNDPSPATETARPQELFPVCTSARQSFGRAQTVEDIFPEVQTLSRTLPQAKSDTSIHQANQEDLLGLAFSGGGIRSATFNLGVLQALAKRRLLSRFDYLSTISGGGYIGAWLTAWIHRRGMREVEARLSGERKDQPHFKDPPEVRFLREYSNYLTPRKGFLGGDTWTAIAIYLRNCLLNQLVLILFIAAVLLAPRALTTFVLHLPHLLATNTLMAWTGTVVVILVLAIPGMWINMRNYSIDPRPDRVLARVTAPTKDSRVVNVKLFRSDTEREFKRLLESHPRVEIWNSSITCRKTPAAGCRMRRFTLTRSSGPSDGTMSFKPPVSVEADDLVIAVYPLMAQAKQIVLFVALPIFLGAITLAYIVAQYGRYDGTTLCTKLTSPWWWAVTGAVIFTALWLLAFVIRPNLDKPEQRPWRKFLSWCFVILSPLPAGATAGLLLYGLTPALEQWAASPAGMWTVLGFGAPIVALILLASTILQTGLLGVVYSEPRREWWGRLASVVLIVCFGWIAAFALAGYSPLLLFRLFSFPTSAWLAAIGWVASTGLGIIGGKSAKVGSLDSHTWKDAVLSVTPYVFIIGLLMMVSLGIHVVLVKAANGQISRATPEAAVIHVSGSGRISLQGDATLQLKMTQQQTRSVPSEPYWREVETSLTPRVYYAFLICLMASFLLALRIDLNEFSMHYLYRNRLVRCYLGASHRERVPNPFTGFDVNDDLHLADLITENFYTGPIPIFGAALNLVHGKDLAWQERKAESFVMTPLFCGFDVSFERFPRPGQWDKRGLEACGYRRTREYAYPEGFFVGTAMAISGAAASPNMGYHSSPALGFLMTIFNVRLGWWVGNPRHRTSWREAGPLVGLGYLLAELFGATDDSRKYVYLSDGGHFENLGLYELVKRRCRFILASDVGADKDLRFGDLASAIRKCRSDMGIEIKLRTDRLGAIGSPPYSRWHCAVGDIVYSGSDQTAKDGVLLYIKASLTSDEAVDILNYKTRYSDFPHQSTADQWFTESQFESYRALGEHVIQSVFHGLSPTSQNALDSLPLDDLIKELREFWKNPEQIQANRWSR